MGLRQALSRILWTARSRGRIVGNAYFISPSARVRVSPGATLQVGRGVHVSSGCSVVIRATSRFGQGTYLGRNSTVVAYSEVDIGAGTLIAENVSIHTENHRGSRLDAYSSRPIRIGERCWLTAGVVVTEGSKIGDATVVGANAVVTGELPGGVVAAGAPARVLGPRNDLS